MRWTVERRGLAGTPNLIDSHVGDGEEGWNQLLSHEDLVVPGRVAGIGLDGSGPPIAFELQPDETLYLAHRRHRYPGPVEQREPVWVVIGAQGPRGDRYLFVGADGVVLCSPNLNAV